ncbi:MAG TPA: PhzF family phenazine biosynthesis protein [Solirubrobacteraceae bacterium]|nr:PhzF family phenazine biosynthesis protein [Solirubrobacteraceae bacterium]
MRSAVQRLGRLTALDALAAVAGQAHRYVRLDVFTEVPLQGNALAVFPGAAGLSGANMQRIARELNLSESVFVLAAREAGDFRLRIFTPTRELAFAGHPVLGAAFLAATALGSDAVALETGAGLVEIELRRDAARVSFGWMAQPIPTWHAYERADELLRALGVSRSGLPIEAYTNGPVHVYVELDSEAAVAGLRPDFGALGGLGEVGVSCFAGAGRAWKTRMFAPALGVAEDPATGSAAGPLAVHLARHARIGFGEEIEISQGVEIGRPSVLHGRADGAREHIERVAVGGAAVITGCGELRLPAE